VEAAQRAVGFGVVDAGVAEGLVAGGHCPADRPAAKAKGAALQVGPAEPAGGDGHLVTPCRQVRPQ
jgi:hypothetical protein